MEGSAHVVTLTHGNVVDDLVLAADVVESLKNRGLIAKGPDGHYAFHKPSTQEILTEVADIEALLKAHDVKIPDNIDRVISSLGLVLPLLGIQ